MITITQFKDNFKIWILGQVDNLSTSTPVLKYTKPILKRSIDKQLSKIDSFLEFITDTEGNIDTDGILDETILTISEPEVNIINIPILGEVELGNSTIKMGIPMTDKHILFKTEDIKTLKEMLKA